MRTPAPLATLLAALAFASPAAAQPADLGVLDPATPVVRIQVRAPAHLAPGKELVYTVRVTNASGAAANRVVVRHPVPEHADGLPKADPEPDKHEPTAKALEWSFARLPAGETQTITLTYKVKPGVRSVSAKAFVTFEHGQEVTTEVESPKVQVTKSAPEKALGTGPIAVAVRVTNTGKVAVRDVRVVETITPGFEFVPDEDGEATGKPTQREWAVKLLAPGESKVIGYRVRLKDAKQGVDFVTTSNVTGGVSPDAVTPAQSATKILTPAIQLKVTGPPTGITGEPSKYVAEVTNTGNTPLDSVRLTVDLPKGSRATAGSAGGQRDGDRLLWDVPADRQRNGPLGTGETARVEFSLASAREGEQVVKVHADGGRGVEKSERVTTAVKGAAGLTYTVDLEPGVLVVGMPGIVTYTVRNNGTAAAKAVVLRVQLPPEVAPKEMTPKYNADRGETAFEPQTILPGDAAKYTITYTAKQPGRAEFTFSLSGEADPKPLVASKMVTITAANQ
jgi:uncharacterized repeat protein (TIGR01451 family)